jgi:beta-phosphoglucomutase family hydrolase
MANPNFDAVIFDLDGVITNTASIHSTAWKQMFDEFLKLRSERTGEPFRAFNHLDDYLPYVDGKPRYQGVASFLESRGIELPYGDPSDPPGMETICGLGNRKNELFNEMIQTREVEVYQTSVEFIRQLKRRNIGVGVASSSKNCRSILESAGLLDLFETRVDGIVSAELDLKGKPEPDIFTTAADNLDASYERVVVVEDAVSGVQAGMNGNFGLVLGVAREDNEMDLWMNGADMVVKDLGEVSFQDLEQWFQKGLKEDQWTLSYHGYSKQAEGLREVLLTLGNGYFGTRGALEETKANGINYPGTYISGVYNRLESKIAGRTIANEDFVNCPNWLPITFRIGDGDWFNPNNSEILRIHRTMDFRTGLLRKEVVVKDGSGRETLIESSRLASMSDPHIAAIKYCISPLNYTDKISIKSGLDGEIVNAGVERYRALNSKHLMPVMVGGEGNLSFLLSKTNQSGIEIAEVAKLQVLIDGQKIATNVEIEKAPASIWSTIRLNAKQGQPICLEKLVAIYTSKTDDVEHPLEEAQATLEAVTSFDEILESTTSSWDTIWKKIDIEIEGDRFVQKLVRLNLYQAMVTASPHNSKLDAGIPARGLHGEAYRGHIFWDELYILPLYNMHFPEVVRAVLQYRYRRLDQARKYAQHYGYKGAMYPWQSGSDGREETQVVHLNPMSGEWGPDYSSLQRHVSLAIAYNIWSYYWITEDLDFIIRSGAEMFLEICRFWASKARYNEGTARYDIDEVMGPDEYHERYPDRDRGGLRNNSYTNIMVAWAFCRAFDILDRMDKEEQVELLDRIQLNQEELEGWKELRSRIYIPISKDGLLEQFEGYFELKELDWDDYRRRYGNIHRMDRILKAEGESPDAYQVSKQADALLGFFVLEPDILAGLLQKSGYPQVDENLLSVNFDYYLKRTSHGSTLSSLVHAYLANLLGNEPLYWKFYLDALTSDYKDIQQGTTKEGIHVGVMAGSTILTLRSFAGLRLDKDEVHLAPHLPKTWRQLKFGLTFKGDRYEFKLSHSKLDVRIAGRGKKAVKLWLWNRVVILESGHWASFELT